MYNELKFEVAGIATILKLNDQSFGRCLHKAYQEFKTSKPADISIEVNLRDNLIARQPLAFGLSFFNDRIAIISDQFNGYWNWKNRQGKVEINSSFPLELLGNFLRNLYTFMIFRDGGLILHACSVVRENMAYIFFGPSGSGKSTVARLSAPGNILSDDLVIIRQVNGAYRIFGTPYWGDMQANNGANGCFKIKGLFKLIQDKNVYLKKLTLPQAVAEALLVPQGPDKLELIQQLLARSSALLKTVPSYQLHFLPDPSFWRCINEEFS
jgi:hypothetical protein